jgi:hypothetical protein
MPFNLTLVSITRDKHLSSCRKRPYKLKAAVEETVIGNQNLNKRGRFA